jgi:trimethylamine:corrinoid methyltransferase-like protein
MRAEQYTPTLSDRENRDIWTAAGGKNARERATEKALSILNAKPQSIISEDVRKRIIAEIPGLCEFLMA